MEEKNTYQIASKTDKENPKARHIFKIFPIIPPDLLLFFVT